MRIIAMLLLSVISTSLVGCSTQVPQAGPSMEQIYDSMDKKAGNADDKQTYQKITYLSNSLPAQSVDREFHKLPNPTLKMYVYPHLAGRDEIPVPGYFTAFNAYNQDYYALPSETGVRIG